MKKFERYTDLNYKTGNKHNNIVGSLMRSQRIAREKQSRKVLIGDVVYASMAHAGRALGKSSCYLSHRIRHCNNLLPDGRVIKIFGKGEDVQI